MSHTYDDIGSILRSMNYEQRELVLELVATVAFTCTTTFGIFPPVDVEAIVDGVAAKLDEMTLPKVTDPSIVRAHKDVFHAEAQRDQVYRIWGDQHGPLATDTKRLADRRLAKAQDALAQLCKDIA